MKRKEFNKNSIIKIIINIILLLLFLSLTFILFSASSIKYEYEEVKYNEKTDISYKVYLENNEFYDEKYLDEGLSYIASLVDKINIDINYLFNIEEDNNIKYSNKIYADLIIATKDESNVFYKKTFDLSTKEDTLNSKVYSYDKILEIDYDYYNDLATSFTTKYGVNTKNYLLIYFDMEKINLKDDSSIGGKKSATIRIPLTENTIEIKVNNLENNGKIDTDKNYYIENKNTFIISVFTLIISIILLFILGKKIISYINAETIFDKYVNKILRGYDRFIVEVEVLPNQDDYKVIPVSKFTELLDVRDNLKEPIKYYLIEEHKKCQFFITHNDELYLLILQIKEN